jgi:NTE family protein
VVIRRPSKLWPECQTRSDNFSTRGLEIFLRCFDVQIGIKAVCKNNDIHYADSLFQYHMPCGDGITTAFLPVNDHARLLGQPGIVNTAQNPEVFSLCLWTRHQSSDHSYLRGDNNKSWGRSKMATQFRNLVFEGGGVKGIAYIGAMQILENRGILSGIDRVGGTSAGAINALLFALGYSIQEQRQILQDTNFNRFMDDSWGVIRDIRRLVRDYGWHKGDFFDSWVGDMIHRRLGNRRATFKDLQQAGRPDLYVIGTNLSTGFAEVFSAERHPDMALATAIRISMSIPIFFAAVRHGPRQDVYVDGGVQLNYPIKLFDRERYIDLAKDPEAVRHTGYYNAQNARLLLDRPGRSPYVYNRQTLGLRLDTQEEISLFRYDEPIEGRPIKSFSDYARRLMGALMNTQENAHLHSDDWQRTVYINTLDVSTTDFDLDDDKKRLLIEQGISGTEHYFGWFDDPEESPVNRI